MHAHLHLKRKYRYRIVFVSVRILQPHYYQILTYTINNIVCFIYWFFDVNHKVEYQVT